MSDKVYSSSTVKSLQFLQHGTIEIEILDSGVFLYVAKGPFNKETLQAIEILHHREVFIEARRRFHQWSEVIVFKESCLFTADAINHLGDYIASNIKQGVPLKGVAFVIPDEMEGLNLTILQVAPLYEKEMVPFKRFSSINEGMSWAESLLIGIEPSYM